MQEKPVQVPTREEWDDWRHNTSQGQLLNKYLEFWLNQLAMQMFDGALIHGENGELKSLEEIAVKNIKEQTKIIVMKALLDLTYEDMMADLHIEPPIKEGEDYSYIEEQE